MANVTTVTKVLLNMARRGFSLKSLKSLLSEKDEFFVIRKGKMEPLSERLWKAIISGKESFTAILIADETTIRFC